MATTFKQLWEHGFGVVTVVDLDIFQGPTDAELAVWAGMAPAEILAQLEGYKTAANPKYITTVKTLKTSTPTQEGPTKTIMGGIRNNKIIKWGKTARLEMTDALVNGAALAALAGAEVTDYEINIGSEYGGPKTLVGETVYVDKITGKEFRVKIIFYSFVPDSIISLTHSAEDDAAVIEYNGDLDAIDVGPVGGEAYGTFYSIVAADPVLREAGEEPEEPEAE
jgi:hypothetical protein